MTDTEVEIVTVFTVCRQCSGSGLYQALSEPLGTACVCLGCAGTGRSRLTYHPYVARLHRNDVTVVKLHASKRGPGSRSVTYDEFLAGKIPT